MCMPPAEPYRVVVHVVEAVRCFLFTVSARDEVGIGGVGVEGPVGSKGAVACGRG